MRRGCVAALLAAVAGCTIDATVFDNPDGVVLTCAAAWASQPGAPCTLDDGPCNRASPFDPECCTDYAYCTSDGLVVDAVCDPGCSCLTDSDCEYGARICEPGSGRCERCPPSDACPSCPEGWVRLQRNGCDSCQCSPPLECEQPGELCDDQASLCYAGASCAPSCDAFTPGCCANTCAAAGCEEPAPVGCFTDCPIELNCRTVCATQRCTCDGTGWTCGAICVEELSVTCAYP